VPVKLDVDTQAAASEAYGIRSIPDTVIALPDGSPVHRFVGFRPPKDFVDELKAGLEARKSYESALQRVKEKPEDPEARLDLGTLYVRWQQWAKAQAEFAAAEKHAGDASPELRVQALYQLGVSQLSGGDEAAADKTFERLAATGAASAKALADDVALERGLAAQARGMAAGRDPDESKKHFDEARRRLEAFLKDHAGSDRAAEGRFQLALTIAYGGDEPAALETLKELVAKHPDSAWADRARNILKQRGE
jgi:TolA-binding protein